MPEIRYDPITGRQVILAEARAARPQAFDSDSEPGASEDCPFCEGSEHKTPGEVLAIRAEDSTPNGPRWRVRVVPNKYPAVTPGGVSAAVDPLSGGDLRGTKTPGVGLHEVIVESPRHLTSITGLSDAEFADVLSVYRDRLAEIRRTSEAAYAVIFKNSGERSGATIEHVHSQLVSLPQVPPGIRQEMDRVATYFQRNGRCAYCDLIHEERTHRERVVLDSKRLLVFCPFAGRVPYETSIFPCQHAASYEAVDDATLEELARVLRDVVGRIERSLAGCAYNYVLHSASFDTQNADHYHWHIEILPRITKWAGFEWGTGCHINLVAPEKAAAALRREV